MRTVRIACVAFLVLLTYAENLLAQSSRDTATATGTGLQIANADSLAVVSLTP